MCNQEDFSGYFTLAFGWTRCFRAGYNRRARAKLNRPGRLFLGLLIATWVNTTPAQDLSSRITPEGRLEVRIVSTTNNYYLLYRSSDPAFLASRPVAIQRGSAGTTTLTEALGADGPAGFYRVAIHNILTPADTDGDGVDDIVEMMEPISMSSLNPAKRINFNDGCARIPDRATFKLLSYQGDQVAIDTQLKGLEFVKFQIEGANGDNPQLFFINTVTHRSHPAFMRAIGIRESGRPGDPNAATMRGVMVFRPLYAGPSGEPGYYTIEFEPNDHFPFNKIQMAHELIAANAPMIRNNMGYNPIGPAVNRVTTEKSLYDASRVPILREKDLFGSIGYLPLNLAQAFGRLRLMNADERPGARDIAIFKALPNELPRVAGIITEVPQTPLSHVNLRAIQDGSPNAFITGASSNAAIAGLIGKNVSFKVESDGFEIREATLEEVNTYFDSIRPREPQFAVRDLSIEAVMDLDDLTFSDAKAVGTKVANLAAMRKPAFGFAEGLVPDGFGIPFYFYDQFMKHNNFYSVVSNLLGNAEFRTNLVVQEEKLIDLRKMIRDGRMPEWMMTALSELQARFPTNASSIRCRSSTNNEDLSDFSGAGLYDSFTHHPDEGHLSKSVKQVYASLWNFRAFEEREFFRIDHFSAAMGVAVLSNYSDEKANGVAVTFDPIYQTTGNYYLNTQLGEDLVTNPDALSIPEEILLSTTGSTYQVVRNSSLVPEGTLLLSSAQLNEMRTILARVQSQFRILYGIPPGASFSMEIEFKVTSAGVLAVKQARPWLN